MGLFKKVNKDAKNQMKQENADLLEYFNKNHDLKVNDIYFDDKTKRALIKKSILFGRQQQVFDYADLLGFTPIFEGSKIKKHHGITRAIVGGALAGPIGALVGAGTGGKEFESFKRLGFMLSLDNNEFSNFFLTNNETKIDSMVGKVLMEEYNRLTAKFEQIVLSNSNQENCSDTSEKDIRYYKKLLDDGIITQEDFDAKKKQLLGI